MTQNNRSEPWEPIVIEKVHLGLLVVVTTLYSLVFVSAYIQLWLILYLRHKLLSTQTVYFYLCCIFTSLRIVLFSMFYNDPINEPLLPIFIWILMCLPCVFQYLIVLLITVFYYKTYVKSTGESSTLTRNSRITIVSVILLQVLLSLIPIWSGGCSSKQPTKLAMTAIYVILTDIIFLATISIFVHVYRQFPKFPNATLVQEAKKITRIRSIIVGLVCIIVTIFKMIYDVIALFGCFNDSVALPNILQESDFTELIDQKHFLIFGAILFLWEVVPLVAVMILFRVRFPSGFFKNRIFGEPANSTTTSYSRSHNASMASNVANQSRFIAIPNYGATNSFIYSPEGSSRMSGNSNLESRRPMRDFSPAVLHSYETQTFPVRAHRNKVISDSCNIQEDIRRENIAKRILPRIWRSSSSKALVKWNSRDRVHDTRASSSRLPTANEE